MIDQIIFKTESGKELKFELDEARVKKLPAGYTHGSINLQRVKPRSNKGARTDV